MISNERIVVVMFSTIVNRYYTPLRCTKIPTPQRNMKRNKLLHCGSRMRKGLCVWHHTRLRTQRQKRHTRRNTQKHTISHTERESVIECSGNRYALWVERSVGEPWMWVERSVGEPCKTAATRVAASGKSAGGFGSVSHSFKIRGLWLCLY